MIKLRLHGERDELLKFIDYLKEREKQGDISILQCSTPYPDRGASKYERMYLDVQYVRGKQ